MKTDWNLSEKGYYGKLYWFAMECREKAFQVLKNKKFMEHWDCMVYGGIITLNPRFHAGIESKGCLKYTLDEFIDELGKRIFRDRFPRELKGFATKAWYSLVATIK